MQISKNKIKIKKNYIFNIIKKLILDMIVYIH